MKKSQLRNIIRKVIKEQEIGKKPKQPMVPDCHMALQMEICEPGNTGWHCGFVFNWQGPIGGGACVQCNGQMCDSGDINQFFDNTSNGPIMTGGSPLKFKLLGSVLLSKSIKDFPYSKAFLFQLISIKFLAIFS